MQSDQNKSDKNNIFSSYAKAKKVTKLQGVLKTDQQADVSALAFFSAF